ncbi:16050_t:CDS:2 [Funneliformis mosseae]|uniref:16050_t:CDS:1 n=1 Tax=Funneliformis mosseae TaxID=27381 RepID=A0A9N9D4K0_FUNMO|nr:16050_t:CDS:2 [Funneliformis mosseae]
MKIISFKANYFHKNNDESQNMNDNAIQYLIDHSINNVISLNQFCLTDNIIGRFKEHSINYLHLPVVDYTASTIYQLHQTYNLYFLAQRITLVYCGYGHSKTDTVIAAFMLLSDN